MFQLNAPNKGGYYPGNTIQYKIVPWHGGLWFAPLLQPSILTSNQAFAQIYNVFTGDADTPTKKGQYRVINNLDAFTFYKRNSTSPFDTLNNPDMVIPPRGTGTLWAGGAAVGIVSNVAGWDNVTQRHSNEWYRGLRGPTAGIYLYDLDGDAAIPDHLSSDSSTQRVYDTADFLVGGTSQFMPGTPTRTMPSAGTLAAHGFGGEYCIQLGSDGSLAPQNIFLLPIPTAGKSQLTLDINVINIVNPNPNNSFQVTFDRIDADGNIQPQLTIQCAEQSNDSSSVSIGSGLTSTVNCTVIAGVTQFALGDALFLSFAGIQGVGVSTNWFITIKVTIQ